MIKAPPINRDIDTLSRLVTGRQDLLFEADLQEQQAMISKAIEGRRILVVGAAGSIGSSTVFQLLRFSPCHLTLVDIAENNLVEVLRTIRSCSWTADAEVAIQPINCGSSVMERFLASQPPFEIVLNFSAAKHVRSERDIISLLNMVDINLVMADRFLGWVRKHGHGRDGVFFVSSDKAANPANLMGATKRLMEQMLFWHASPMSTGRTLANPHADCGSSLGRATTARFANVAFSDGSLPLGFLHRIAKRQPLSGPSDVRRFFLSLQESGQLCTLASLVCPSESILIPRLDPVADMHTFGEIAGLTLAHFGFEPLHCAGDTEARSLEPGASGRWPCVFSESTTMGEKLFEEFEADGESAMEIGLKALLAIPHGFSSSGQALCDLFAQLAALVDDPYTTANKDQVVEILRTAVPTLKHIPSTQSLDGRM